jgi:serine/threonine-protein phosphatase 2A regulatory subunit B'
MVYNAMKLFMEINPQLFDDCSHDYTELQSTADQRQAQRQSKWDKLAEQAKKMQAQSKNSSLSHRGPKVAAPPRIDEDPITKDSQQRLDALKLQDEGSNGVQNTVRPHQSLDSVHNCF